MLPHDGMIMIRYSCLTISKLIFLKTGNGIERLSRSYNSIPEFSDIKTGLEPNEFIYDNYNGWH